MVTSLTDRPTSALSLDWQSWSDADYSNALSELEPLFNSPIGTPESNRADLLFDAIEAYEEKRYQLSDWLSKPALPDAVAEYEATRSTDANHSATGK